MLSLKFLPSKFRVKDKPGYLHSKAIIVDSDHAWVGSVNGSNSAFNVNREFGIFVDDVREVKKLEAFMKKTHEDEIMESFDQSAACENDESFKEMEEMRDSE